MCPGGVTQLHGTPVMLTGLLLVGVLQIEISEKKMQGRVVRHDVHQLLQPAQRLGVIAALLAGNGRHDHRPVYACDPVRRLVENDGRQPHQNRQQNDGDAFHRRCVGEEDHEPVEDQPHRSEPQKDREKQEREGQHRHRATTDAFPQELAEVVSHGPAVANEQCDGKDCRRQRDGQHHDHEHVGEAQNARSIIAENVREAAQHRRNGHSPVLPFRGGVGPRERDRRGERVELIRRFVAPVHGGLVALLRGLAGQGSRRLGVQRKDFDAVGLADVGQFRRLLERGVDVAAVDRSRGLRPDVAWSDLLGAQRHHSQAHSGEEHRADEQSFHHRLFVRWTNASFNSPRCVCKKSSSCSVRLPTVFSLSMPRISIICRAAAASMAGFC